MDSVGKMIQGSILSLGYNADSHMIDVHIAVTF